MASMFIEFSYTINGKSFRFQVEPNTPYPDAREAIFYYLKDLGNMEDAGKASQASLESPKEQSSEEKPIEPTQES